MNIFITILLSILSSLIATGITGYVLFYLEKKKIYIVFLLEALKKWHSIKRVLEGLTCAAGSEDSHAKYFSDKIENIYQNLNDLIILENIILKTSFIKDIWYDFMTNYSIACMQRKSENFKVREKSFSILFDNKNTKEKIEKTEEVINKMEKKLG